MFCRSVFGEGSGAHPPDHLVTHNECSLELPLVNNHLHNHPKPHS